MIQIIQSTNTAVEQPRDLPIEESTTPVLDDFSLVQMRKENEERFNPMIKKIKSLNKILSLTAFY